MIFKRYILHFLSLTLLWTSMFILFNYIQDDFGLFRGGAADRRIWVHEKTSKYLMSYNYIGSNFDGILIGSSVSANLNPNFLLPNYNIYNLSMNGGNITELKYAIDKLLEKRQIKYMIFCLHAYMTKNSGLKDNQINKKKYWMSLFSLLPVHVLREKFWCMIGAPDVFHSSTSGFNNYNIFRSTFDFKEKIKTLKKQMYDLKLDPIAHETLKQILVEARSRDIKIIAYYHPIYKEVFNTYSSASWERYKTMIDKLFKENDIIWDMNDKKYKYINEYIKNYSDGHLSDQGAVEVLKEIEHQLDIAMQ